MASRIVYIARLLKRIETPAAKKPGRRNSVRSRTGAGVRATCRRSHAPEPNARPASAATPHHGIPGTRQRVPASVSATRVARTRTAPSRSKRPPAFGAACRGKRAAQIRPGTSTIRLTAKIQRHPNASVTTPPSGGPSAAASPMPAPISPSARPWRSTGSCMRTKAVPLGIALAPVIAWSVRATTSTSMLGANAATMVATVKPPRPSSIIRRRP